MGTGCQVVNTTVRINLNSLARMCKFSAVGVLYSYGASPLRADAHRRRRVCPLMVERRKHLSKPTVPGSTTGSTLDQPSVTPRVLLLRSCLSSNNTGPQAAAAQNSNTQCVRTADTGISTLYHARLKIPRLLEPTADPKGTAAYHIPVYNIYIYIKQKYQAVGPTLTLCPNVGVGQGSAFAR